MVVAGLDYDVVANLVVGIVLGYRVESVFLVDGRRKFVVSGECWCVIVGDGIVFEEI